MNKPLAVVPIPALSDNYIWLLSDGRQAACVDPGEAAPVLDFLDAHGLTLAQIWITHHHSDHTGGVAELKRRFPECAVYGGGDVPAADMRQGRAG